MTKKEIIRNLKYTMEKHKNDRVDTFGTNISLMCKDILDYLEQEHCGKDINVHATDCISRQAAIDSLGECPMNWTDSEGEVTAERDWKDTVEMLKSLPSVIPQPKTGHWVKTPKAVMGEGYMWYCDRCEHQVYQDSSEDYPSEKYCPKCGRKMVKQ